MNSKCTRASGCRRAFILFAPVVVFALVAGLATTLTLHVGQLARDARRRSLDVELRQMIDSGLAFAKLHRSELERGEVVLDTSELCRSDRTASVTLSPIQGHEDETRFISLTATIKLSETEQRSMTARSGF